jgi:SAM-dependent methyltransferase
MADDFDSLLRQGEALSVSGWDTTPVGRRWRRGVPPWNYRQLARRFLDRSRSVLDLGTGGGELLASLVPLPRIAWATEGYPPNLPVARRRLEPLGVRVLPIGGDQRIALPSGSVDLVLCRHEAFDANEVHRVLVPGGAFLTQQVGARNYEEINERFGVPPAPATNALRSLRDLDTELTRAGLRVVDHGEAEYADRFEDVGALVWYLRLAPWQVPGFSAERCRGPLRAIHEEIGRLGSFGVTTRRLFVVALRR